VGPTGVKWCPDGTGEAKSSALRSKKAEEENSSSSSQNNLIKEDEKIEFKRGSHHI
jgi:hypothetical protein